MSDASPSFFQPACPMPPRLHRFEHRAMACLWELYLLHDDASYAEHAARAAFDEVDRLERELSRFVEFSDVSQFNSAPAGRPVRLSLDAFECLSLAAELSRETHGAFDPTVGALSRSPAAAAGASDAPPPSAPIGMHLVALHTPTRQAAKLSNGVSLDLGGIGKGYAVDRAVQVLREWSIAAGLIHSGQSSLFALGAPEDAAAWTIAVRDPADHARMLGTLEMCEASLSGSGVLLHGRHILDPRTGGPSQSPAIGAWALGPSAAVTDAVSTAFMVMSEAEVAEFCRAHAPLGGMLCLGQGASRRIECFGLSLRPA